MVQGFGGFKKTPYLCTRLQQVRALSSAGLEHLPYKQRVGGSNPSAPTEEKVPINISGLFSFLSHLCPSLAIKGNSIWEFK